jgi:hypothetical protein
MRLTWIHRSLALVLAAAVTAGGATMTGNSTVDSLATAGAVHVRRAPTSIVVHYGKRV